MNTKRVLTTAALTLALTAATTLAQSPNRRLGHGRMLERAAIALDLTETQKSTAKTIFEESRTASAPLIQQLRENRKAIAEAIKAGKSESELASLANQAGTVKGQLSALRATSMSKFYALLTPAQREKADQLQNTRRQRRHGDREKTVRG